MNPSTLTILGSISATILTECLRSILLKTMDFLWHMSSGLDLIQNLSKKVNQLDFTNATVLVMLD